MSEIQTPCRCIEGVVVDLLTVRERQAKLQSDAVKRPQASPNQANIGQLD